MRKISREVHASREILLRQLSRRYGFILDLSQKESTDEGRSKAATKKVVDSQGGTEEYGPAAGSGSTSGASSRSNSPKEKRDQFPRQNVTIDKETGIISVKKSKTEVGGVETAISAAPTTPSTWPTANKLSPLKVSTDEAKAFVLSSRRERTKEERLENRISSMGNDTYQVAEVRQEVRALYRVYQPEKSKELVEKILTQFRNREEILLKQLRKKFNVPESTRLSSAEGESNKQGSARITGRALVQPPKEVHSSPLEPHKGKYMADLNSDNTANEAGEVPKDQKSDGEVQEIKAATHTDLGSLLPSDKQPGREAIDNVEPILESTTMMTDMGVQGRIGETEKGGVERTTEAECAGVNRSEIDKQARKKT